MELGAQTVAMTEQRHSARNTDAGLLSVPLHWVQPSALNPRRHFDQEALEQLAGSIRDNGLLEPIVVRRLPTANEATSSPPFYELVAGERRWRASNLAGLENILIRNLGEIDDATALQLALIENLHRQDLDPIEEAEGYRQLNRIVGLKQSEIAAAVNRSQPAIANTMRLLDLPEDVQERIRRRELSVAHGIALARFKEFPKIASKIAEISVNKKTPAKGLERDVPHGWELDQAGLIKSLSYSVPFDMEAAGCKKCPFGAYRKDGAYGGGYCLNSPHYDELATAAKQAEKERLAELQDDGELPDMADMSYGTYERIWDADKVPAGCSEACACRAQALTGGTPVPICTDPERWRKLRAAEERAEAKRQRELEAAKVERLKAFIDGLDEIESRELVVLVVASIGHGYPAAWKAAFERHGLSEELVKRVTGTGRSYEFPALQYMPVVAFFKAALEAKLHDEVHSYLSHHDGDRDIPMFDWLLDGKLPTLPPWMQGEQDEDEVGETKPSIVVTRRAE